MEPAGGQITHAMVLGLDEVGDGGHWFLADCVVHLNISCNTEC